MQASSRTSMTTTCSLPMGLSSRRPFLCASASLSCTRPRSCADCTSSAPAARGRTSTTSSSTCTGTRCRRRRCGTDVARTASPRTSASKMEHPAATTTSPFLPAVPPAHHRLLCRRLPDLLARPGFRGRIYTYILIHMYICSRVSSSCQGRAISTYMGSRRSRMYSDLPAAVFNV